MWAYIFDEKEKSVREVHSNFNIQFILILEY